jgi:uncharacterized protein DUF4129
MRSGASRRAALLGAALLGLVAVVALASRARTPTGGSPTKSVSSDVLVEYLLLLAGVVFVAGVWTGIYLLVLAHQIDRGPLPRRQSLWRTLLFVTVVAASVVAASSILHDFGHNTQRVKLPGQPPAATAQKTPRAAPVAFDWVPVAVVGGLTLLGLAAVGGLLMHRRVPKKRLHETPAEAVAAALDESVDDLLAEPDPRRAVIAAYARMERALAGSGLARRRAEAPREFLTRTLRELGAGAGSVERLTGLFERAKFSPHTIDASMKDDAIAALAALRDELREAE